MPFFPVTSSVLAAAPLGRLAAERYALPAAPACRLLKTGINHTYRIDAGGQRFVLRVYSLGWRTQQEILEELRLLNLLQLHGISVSYPIADRHGQYIQTIAAPEGDRYAVLFSFAEGKKLLQFGRDTHREIGRIMARMHRLTRNFPLERITYTAQVLLKDSLQAIRQFLPEDTEEMQFLEKTGKKLENNLLAADLAAIRTGAVHLDIWFDNLNISPDHGVTLFDFDFCGNGWLCLDLAYYIMQVHSTEKVEGERTDKIAAFLEGYESVEQISPEERRLLPILGVSLYFFYLGIQCSRFNDWSNTFLNEAYLSRFITVLIKGYYEATAREEVEKGLTPDA